MLHKQREFIALAGGATVAWLLAARAQHPAMPVIRYLNTGSSNSFAHLVNAFRLGLNDGVPPSLLALADEVIE
jgi:putative tryptophan/tyrosine transport system substrate-binding protein